MSHDPNTYSNYKRQSARVAQSDWRLNDDGRIEDLIYQVQKKGKWVDFLGTLSDFFSRPVSDRRVIWRPR